MAELRYRAGKIKNPRVHKIGVIALGSHLENHGPALPIDTDAKIGAHIAFQASLESGAKFLGIVFPAYELDEIDHGVHVSLDELKANVISTLNSAKKYLDIEKVVIVNSHGGNIPLMTELYDIEDKTVYWREGCEDCLRRTSQGHPTHQVQMMPPAIIVFECEYRIAPDDRK